MKTKTTTTTTKIPFITSLIKSIKSIKPIIMPIFIFVAIGIFISTTTKKNIQEGAEGLTFPTVSTNFFRRSASIPRDKPRFPGELQDQKQSETKKTQQQQDRSKIQDTSKTQETETKKTPDQKQSETIKTPETGKNLKEIIFSILVPLETVIKLPDKTDIK